MSGSVVDISKINFYGTLGVDYNWVTNCEEYGCDDEGICRCGTMEDVHIDGEDIDLIEITDIVYKYIFGLDINDIAIKREILIDDILGINEHDITKYFIHRILTMYKIYSKDSWEIDYVSSYYGDEIESVKMFNSKKMNDDFYMLFSDNKNKIEYLLNKEYGHVLDKLLDKKWDVDIVDMKDIHFPQKEHYNNVSEGLDYYSDTAYDLPRGIVLKEGNKYRVIDGYHRIKNTKQDFVEVIVAL